VVKPHGESSVTLLTARNNVSLKEASRIELLECGKALHLPVVKSYDFTGKNFGEILRSFDGLSWHDEGYVVVDANNNRVKVKNPAYVAVHHLKGKTAEHNIMTIVKTNEIEEFGATFPDRKEELNNLKAKYDELTGKLNYLWVELQNHKPKNIMPSEKKKFAEAVFRLCNQHNLKTFTGLYFGLIDGKVPSIEDYMLNYDDKALYKLL